MPGVGGGGKGVGEEPREPGPLLTKILSGTHLPAGSLAQEDEVLALSVPDGWLVEGQEGGASRAELSWILQHRFLFLFFLAG